MEWDVENLAEQQSELPNTVGLRKEEPKTQGCQDSARPERV